MGAHFQKVNVVSIKPPKLSTAQGRIHLTNFLKFHFDITYRFCLCPFSIKLARNTSGSFYYKVKSSTFQNFICIFLNILGCIWDVGELRTVVTFGSQIASTQYFYIALKVVFILSRMTLFWKYSRCRGEFLEIVNFILDERNPLQTRNIAKMRVALLMAIAAGGSFVIGTFCWLSGMLLTNREIFGNGWSITLWWSVMRKWGYVNLFLEDQESLMDSRVSDSCSIVGVIVGGLAVAGYFAKEMSTFYLYVLIHAEVLTMWTVVDGFVYSLNGDKLLSADEVISEYESIKELCSLFNRTLGSLVTYFLVDVTLIYAINMGNFFRGLAGFVFTLSFTFFFIIILVLAADVVHKVQQRILPINISELFKLPDFFSMLGQMNRLKIWLGKPKNRNGISGGIDQIAFIMNDLDTNAVAIKGSNIYAINFSLLASVK